MIRNVVISRMRQPDDPGHQALMREGLAAMAALKLPGMLAMHVGADAGLREGNWSFSITNDWRDVDAYRGYDQDEEHNRIRREIFAVISEEIARVQFEIED